MKGWMHPSIPVKERALQGAASSPALLTLALGATPILSLTPTRPAELQHMAKQDQNQPWLLSRLLRPKTMVRPAAL